MRNIMILMVLMLTACEEKYRYKCQDPDHFQDAECQHPKCEFTQTCPEYLVAPLVEKKVEPSQTKAPTNCR